MAPDPFGELSNGDVLTVEVEDPRVPGEDRRLHGLGDVTDMEQRSVLVSPEDAQPPVEHRFDGEQIQDEIHTDA